MKNVTLALAALLYASAGFAEPAAQPADAKKKAAGSVGTSSAAPASASEMVTEQQSSIRKSLFGALDIRPSVDLSAPHNQIRLETDVELGYQFTPNTSIMYEQDLYHVLNDKNGQAANEVKPRDGFFKLKLNNLATSGRLSFGFENRVFMPTSYTKSSWGMITEIRNYLKLGYRASNSIGVTLMSVPILHAYARPNSDAKGTLANPALEHRTYLVLDASMFKGKLNASLPIILNTYLFRSSVGAMNSGRMGNFLWINPEIMYSVSPNVAIGVSYYSDNLLVPDLDTGIGTSKSFRLDMWRGLKNGVPQLALRATL